MMVSAEEYLKTLQAKIPSELAQELDSIRELHSKK